jgi:CBS domain-containing protein
MMAYGPSARRAALTAPVLASDPIRVIMRFPVSTVDVAASLREAAEQLSADEIGALLVTGEGAPGVLSERDVITAIAGGADLGVVQAGDAFNSDLLWAAPDISILQAGILMVEGGVRHLPIGDGRNAVGIVSIRDVLAVLVDPDGAL